MTFDDMLAQITDLLKRRGEFPTQPSRSDLA